MNKRKRRIYFYESEVFNLLMRTVAIAILCCIVVAIVIGYCKGV